MAKTYKSAVKKAIRKVTPKVPSIKRYVPKIPSLNSYKPKAYKNFEKQVNKLMPKQKKGYTPRGGFPPSKVSIKSSGIYFEDFSDRVNYTMNQLVCRALVDVGKMLNLRINIKAQKTLRGMRRNPRVRGKMSAFGRRWNRDEQCIEIGTRFDGWYGVAQELGSSKMPRLGLIQKTVNENIADIVRIEEHYLGKMNNTNDAESTAATMQKFDDNPAIMTGE